MKVLLFGYGLTRQVYEAGHLISPMVGGQIGVSTVELSGM